MNIAIAGYGAEGKSNLRYFSGLGHQVTILDENPVLSNLPPEIPVRLGEDAFKNLADFDMVVRGGGLLPHKLKQARKIWSATNEFFVHCPAPIIGVTGTKGKGTTVSLIASILKHANKTVHVVGNIGTPPLDELPKITANDLVVYELSSFQLLDIQRSPHIAIVLMIEPDHLDVHATFEEYVSAKQNITRFQTKDDLLIFAKTNSYATAIANSSKAQKLPVPTEQTAYVAEDYFWYGTQKICPIKALKLPGSHNRTNACAAIAAAWQYTQDIQAIEAGLTSFTGLPHRLKYVRTVNKVAYYDDSIATTVGSAAAAIRSFDQPKILILGGSSKGTVDFNEVAKAAATSNVKKVLVIGQQAPTIITALEAHRVPYENLGTEVSMTDIVQRAYQLAKPGDVVILSPACASFGMFQNYADRGDQFITAVNAL